MAAPFSELIRAWLDEGDRLDEKAIATAASVPAVTETRVRRLLSLLRPALERYRVLVFAAAGLVPLALFTVSHRSPAAPAPAVATATPMARVPAAPAAAPPRWEGAAICESSETAPALPGVRSLDPRPVARPHHHHHHQAAIAHPASVAHPGPAPIAAPRPHPVPAAVAAPARPSAPAVAVVRPVAPVAPAAPAAPPRRAFGPTKGQPLR